jgi:predicted nucleic acid-binding protein
VTAPLLVDASVWLASLDTDDVHHDAARELLERAARGTATLAALDLTLYEVANVATVRWRSPADAERLATLVRLACPDTLEAVDDDLIRTAAAIAHQEGLTVYDAAYIAAAREHGWTLLSCDVADLVTPGHAVLPGDAPAD